MNRRWTAVCFFVLLILGTSAAQNYAPAVNYATQVQPVGIATGDLNEDGFTDLVVTNTNSSTLSLLLGRGDGSFGNAISIATGADPISVAVGDFNGDGHLDLAVSLGNSQAFQILFGNGNGVFQSPVTVAIPGLAATATQGQIVAQDINGDKRPDIAIATDNGAAIFLNNGVGSFVESANINPGAVIGTLRLADVNRDGRVDVVAVQSAADANASNVTNVFLALGNGDGSFQPISAVTQITGPPAGLALADLNNDGLIDIVVSTGATFAETGGGGGGGIGGGGEGCTLRICPLQNGPTSATTGTITVPGALSILLQQANGTFTLGNQLRNDQNPGDVVLGDFNGDGNLDISEASSSSAAILMFLGQGNGSFGAPASLTVPVPSAVLAAGPFTNTVALDLSATNPSGNEISVFVNLGANTLNLSSSPNPSLASQPVTLTATVRPKFPANITMSGSVVFADGANTLGTALVNSSGVSTLTTPFSSTGNHPLMAVFSGNSSLVGGALSTTTQVVNAASATVTLASSANPTVFGQQVTFTATVSGAAVVPTGSMNIMDGGTTIATGVLDSAGRFALTTSSLALGTHTLVAQYSGDQVYRAGSSAPISQTVDKSNAGVILSSSQNPGTFGQAMVFTVSVSASGGSGLPTGTVTLRDTGATITSAPLDNAGTVTLTVTSLSVGQHFITAVYSGDSNFDSGFSGQLNQIVNVAATSTALTNSPNPSSFGESVQLVATVSAVAPASGVPTGSVAFSDGANLLGSAPLNNGRAALPVASFSVGSHSITATYSGDQNFSPSAAVGSAGANQSVSKANSSTALTSSPNPSAFGQSVTLTASVAPATGAGAPTGVVSFSDGTNSLGTATLVNGSASITVNFPNAGAHSLVANYSGDSNFTLSSSVAITQNVGKAGSVINASSNPNPSVLGQPVVFSATVSSASGGIGTPSGTVIFADASGPIGTAPIDASGKTSVTISTLPVGAHNLQVSYGGDSNFQSSSSVLPHTVNPSASSTIVVASPNPGSFGQSVTLTATVSGSTPSSVTPSGTVAFADGATVLGSVTLDTSGRAVLNTTRLSAGTHPITGTYSGDSNFATSTASTTEVVNPASTSVSLASSLNPASVGQLVTFTATVTSANGGAPLGNVSIFDGSTNLGSATLNAGGSASLSTSSLSAGLHNITAAYSGASNFSASTSAQLSQAINKDAVSVTLSSLANPAVFGQAVALRVRVAPGNGTGTVPSGAISILDGSSAIGSAILDNTGNASVSVSLASGSHVLVAAYAGDANFNAGSSSALAETINKQATFTSIRSSLNPATNASPVVVSVAVVATNSTPTGSVTIVDGSQQIAVSAIDATGRSNVTLNNLSVGSHLLSAIYTGDANFLTSTSPALNEAVVDSHSRVTLTSSANAQTAGAPVTFMASVTLSLGGQASAGLVTFLDGQTTLDTVPVVSSIASLTTKTLSPGVHSIVARFQQGSAPGPFDGSSAALQETITAVKAQKDFAVALRQDRVSILAGQSFSTLVILTPENGFAGTVDLKCLNLPVGATCELNPQQLFLNGKSVVVSRLLISTTGRSRVHIPRRPGRDGDDKPIGNHPELATLLPAALFGCVLLPVRKGKLMRKGRGLLALLAITISLAGCGGSVHANGPNTVDTPRGAYTVIVQANSGSTTHAKTLHLIVR